MKKIKFSFFALVLTMCLGLSGCKDSPTEATSSETLIYQFDGVLENLGGDCSAVQVRTRSLGNIDLSSGEKIKFNFSGMSDADLSSITIYYVQNDEQINLVSLANSEEINNTGTVRVDSPGLNTELFCRVTLKSSVCTGQIFYLSFSDLKIYTIM